MEVLPEATFKLPDGVQITNISELTKQLPQIPEIPKATKLPKQLKVHNQLIWLWTF